VKKLNVSHGGECDISKMYFCVLMEFLGCLVHTFVIINADMSESMGNPQDSAEQRRIPQFIKKTHDCRIRERWPTLPVHLLDVK